MADVQLDDFGDGRHGFHVVGGESVPGSYFETARARSRGTLREPLELPRRPGTALQIGVAVLPRVELDLLDSERRRRFDLRRIRGDEQASTLIFASRSRSHSGSPRAVPPAMASRPPSVVRSSRRSGTSVTTRQERDAFCNRDHLVGCRHLQVDRARDGAPQPNDVVVGDVTTILAKVRRDPVRAGCQANRCATYGVGVWSAAGVPHRRDVVDVDVEANHPTTISSGAPTEIAGIRRFTGTWSGPRLRRTRCSARRGGRDRRSPGSWCRVLGRDLPRTLARRNGGRPRSLRRSSIRACTTHRRSSTPRSSPRRGAGTGRPSFRRERLRTWTSGSAWCRHRRPSPRPQAFRRAR